MASYSPHSTSISRICSVITVVFAATITIVLDWFREFAEAYVAPVYQAIKTAACRTVDGFMALAQANPDHSKPAVARERAKAFQGRLVKRDRPVITASWRMCPST